jgi:hypothetical protein
LDACVEAEHYLESTYPPGRSPSRVQWLDELARTFRALAARGSTVVLYVDDLTREFQNLVLAEVAGRAVPLRTCASLDAKVLTAEGLMTAKEAGAPVETSTADRQSDIRAGA